MFARIFCGTIAFSVAIFLIAGCQYSPDIAQRTIAYNQSIADSTNNLFLLNALRAAERQPTYYSRNQANTTTASLSPGLTGTFPWGKTPTNSLAKTVNSDPVMGTTGFMASTLTTASATKAALALTPSFTATESNQLTLSNLDDQPSTNGLLTPVSVQQIENYANQGYNSEQLDLLYISNFSIPLPILKNLPNAVAEYCAAKLQSVMQDDATGKLAMPDLYCSYLFGSSSPQPFPVRTDDKHVVWPEGSKPKNIYKFKWDDLRHNDRPQVGPANASPQKVIDPECFGYAQESEQPISAESPEDEIIDAGNAKPMSGASAGVTSVTLLNDPAIYKIPAANDAPVRIKTFECFKEVLVTLLALEFAPTDGQDKAVYRLRLDYAKNNPRYFSDLTQQGFDIAMLQESCKKNDKDKKDIKDGKLSCSWTAPDNQNDADYVGVCKKASDMSFAIVADGYVKALFALGNEKNPPGDWKPEKKATGKASGKKPAAANGPDSAEINSQHYSFIGTTSGRPETITGHASGSVRQLAVKSPNLPGALQLDDALDKKLVGSKIENCGDAASNWQSTKGQDTPTLTISVTPRSLEAMVYYLGQIIRSKYGTGMGQSGRIPAGFLNWRYPPDVGSGAEPFYEEDLFRVDKGAAPKNAIAEASDIIGTYYVPDLCADDPPDNNEERSPSTAISTCTAEYPEHSSAQILTMLNQIWGLNKAQTAAPIIPTVNVVP